MSKGQVLFSQALLASRRNAQMPQINEGSRSFRRVVALLGLSATAAATWYGACYLYQWYNLQQSTLRESTSQTFSIENSVATGVLPHDKQTGVVPSVHEVGDWDVKRKTVHVILHQCPRGYYTPCIAPFPMKLETFLRVANIEYDVNFTSHHLNNKTSPWMTVNGVDILESHECVPHLCNIFGIDLEKSATQPSRLTASRLVGIMLDNHIYWGIALWRWVYDAGRSLKVIQPLSPVGQDVVTEVSASVTRASWYHGLGRLSKEQAIDLVLIDLSDLSAALGNHDFFLGTQPGEVDCNAFAMLSQMLWNMPESPFEFALQKYTNLVNFVLRMRERYWPDWESLLQRQGHADLSDKLFYPTGEFQVSRAVIEDSGTNSANAENPKASPANISKPAIASKSAIQQNKGGRPSQQSVKFSQDQPAKSVQFQTPDGQVVQQSVQQNPGQEQTAVHHHQVNQQKPALPPRPVQQQIQYYEQQSGAQQSTGQTTAGQVYPAMTTNNTVVNQDQKILHQNEAALAQQHLSELSRNNQAAQLRTNVFQPQQYAPVDPYYQINPNQMYQNRGEVYDDSQAEYQNMEKIKYEQQQMKFQQVPNYENMQKLVGAGAQVYLGNNPFINQGNANQY